MHALIRWLRPALAIGFCCMLRWRSVEPISGRPGVYLVVCKYRGGFVTTADGTWFCCNHSIATHDHSGFGTL